MTIDLDQLQRLAEAVVSAPRGEDALRPWTMHATCEERELIDALEPEIILELIAHVRRAESALAAERRDAPETSDQYRPTQALRLRRPPW